MDTMHRNKTRKAGVETATHGRQKQKKHVSDGFKSKMRPRETYSDEVDSKKRISRNLKKLNRNLVEHPFAAKEEALVPTEDRGAKVETKAAAVSAPIPLALIFSLAMLLVVFMYVVFLDVQVEEYSQSIDVMESRVAQLKEEATRLELQLESKYDLGEIERIATEEYGMVVSSSLPKKYISVSAGEDVWQETEQEKTPSLVEKMISGFNFVFGSDEE